MAEKQIAVVLGSNQQVQLPFYAKGLRGNNAGGQWIRFYNYPGLWLPPWTSGVLQFKERLRIALIDTTPPPGYSNPGGGGPAILSYTDVDPGSSHVDRLLGITAYEVGVTSQASAASSAATAANVAFLVVINGTAGLSGTFEIIGVQVNVQLTNGTFTGSLILSSVTVAGFPFPNNIATPGAISSYVIASPVSTTSPLTVAFTPTTSFTCQITGTSTAAGTATATMFVYLRPITGYIA